MTHVRGVPLLLAAWLACSPAWGQTVSRTGPVRASELISLTPDLPFDQALRVIQTFAGRVIVDTEHRTAPIGVDIDRMPWREALARIVAHHGMQVVSRDLYLELVPGGEGAAAGQPPAPTVPEVSLDSREVTISAVFFQADQGALREIGIDWTTLSGGEVDVSVANLGSSGAGRFTARLGSNVGRSVSVDLLMQTFESTNSGEIIARPQIKVRSGKPGYIQVGSDFSVTKTDFAGNTVTDFFKTGTILEVEPVIITSEDVDFVDLMVKAERSSLIDPVRQVISRTVASTSTLLRDGEQTAIAGLYGQEITTTRTGVPLLKDLPGWLLGVRYFFGSDSRLVSKTELVVLLEVDIVPSVRERVERGPPAKAFDPRPRDSHESGLPDSLRQRRIF